MLEFLKSTDTKLSEQGFNKIFETLLSVRYERYDEAFNFIHVVDINRKLNGTYELQSYDSTNTDFFSPVVALTDYEFKLFNKKINEMKHPF